MSTITLGQRLRAEIARIETFADDPAVASNVDLLKEALLVVERGTAFNPAVYQPKHTVQFQREIPQDALSSAAAQRDVMDAEKIRAAEQIGRELLWGNFIEFTTERSVVNHTTRLCARFRFTPSMPSQPQPKAYFNDWAAAMLQGPAPSAKARAAAVQAVVNELDKPYKVPDFLK